MFILLNKYRDMENICKSAKLIVALEIHQCRGIFDTFWLWILPSQHVNKAEEGISSLLKTK